MTTAQLTETIDEARIQENANIRAYVDEAHRQVDQGASERDLRAARRSISRETSQSLEPSIDEGSRIGPFTPALPASRRDTSAVSDQALSPVAENDIDSGSSSSDAGVRSSGSSLGASGRGSADSSSSDEAFDQRRARVVGQHDVNGHGRDSRTPRIPSASPYRKFVDWLDISFNRERAIYRNAEDATVIEENMVRNRFLGTVFDVLSMPVRFVLHLVKATYQIMWCFLCLICWVPAMIISPYWRQRVGDTMRQLAITLGMQNATISYTMSALPFLMLGALSSSFLLFIYTDSLPRMGYQIGHTAQNLKACLLGVSHGFNTNIDFDASALAMIDSRLDKVAHVASTASQTLVLHQSRLDKHGVDLSKHSSDLKALYTSVTAVSATKRANDHAVSTPLYDQINYAGEALGAVIDPYLTSPSYERRQSSLNLFLTRLLAPRATHFAYRSRPPSEALRPWREYGDCWCAPSSSDSAIQLGVLLGQNIIPTEAVLEQLPSPENPHPDRTPRMIEVWADYSHLMQDEFDAAARQSVTLPYGDKTRRHGVPEGYLLVGIMEIDARGFSETASRVGQTLPLKRLGSGSGLPTSKIVFAVIDNYGGEMTCLYRVRVHGKLREGEEE